MIPLANVMTRPVASGRPSASTLTSADDVELIDRFLRAGDDDEEIFEILVRRYQDKVFRLAASILGRGAGSEAEDATQEVFVVLLRRLQTFRRECRFSTWLYRLARHQIIDYRRRVAHRASDVDDGALLNIPDGRVSNDPRRAADAGRRRDRILRHVDRLAEPQRVVVYLHYWQEQSVAEIAELLDLKPGTVKSHLHRARRRLAIALREGGHDA